MKTINILLTLESEVYKFGWLWEEVWGEGGGRFLLNDISKHIIFQLIIFHTKKKEILKDKAEPVHPPRSQNSAPPFPHRFFP